MYNYHRYTVVQFSWVQFGLLRTVIHMTCRCLYQITTNGYVTMGASYESRTPTTFTDMLSASKKSAVVKTGFAIFAPMWTDCDATKGDVFYHIYDGATKDLSNDNKARARHGLVMAAEDVRKFGGISDVNPSFVMVITWANMIPRASYKPANDKVMFY